MRVCSTCLVEKPDIEFHVRRAGRRMVCKTCSCIAARALYKQKRIEILQYCSDRRKREPELFRERARIQRQKHREQRSATFKRWYRKVYNATPEIFRERAKAQGARRRSAVKQTVHPITPAEWVNLIKAFDNCCAYCLEPFTDDVRPTQDHLTPVAHGGQHTLKNIVPACQPCNRRKSDRTYDEFLSDLPPLTASLPRPIQIDASGVHLTL